MLVSSMCGLPAGTWSGGDMTCSSSSWLYDSGRPLGHVSCLHLLASSCIFLLLFLHDRSGFPQRCRPALGIWPKGIRRFRCSAPWHPSASHVGSLLVGSVICSCFEAWRVLTWRRAAAMQRHISWSCATSPRSSARMHWQRTADSSRCGPRMPSPRYC